MKKIYLFIILIFVCFQSLSFADEIKDEMYYKRQIQNQRFLYSNAGFVNAIRVKNLTVIDAFIKSGFDVNETYGKTPLLFYAILYNSPEEVKMLLEAGADPNVSVPPMFVKAKSINAILYSIDKKNSQIVEYLIEHNVNINENFKGETPLNYAIKKKQGKIVSILLKSGAKSNEKTAKLVKKTKDEYIKSLF